MYDLVEYQNKSASKRDLHIDIVNLTMKVTLALWIRKTVMNSREMRPVGYEKYVCQFQFYTKDNRLELIHSKYWTYALVVEDQAKHKRARVYFVRINTRRMLKIMNWMLCGRDPNKNKRTFIHLLRKHCLHSIKARQIKTRWLMAQKG